MIENIFVIPVLPEMIIVDNEANEIIHDFENDNEYSLFLYNKSSDYNKR